MNGPCMLFCQNYLLEHEINGKSVLDVGSYNVNGSFRILIEPHNPSKYLGVDMTMGPDVDKICSATDLIKTFGENSFDIVVSAEMLEHVHDWKEAIHNIKGVCKRGGTILLTTRSKGFPYHGCPEDFYRFNVHDMLHIFSDCELLGVQTDFVSPGIFIKVRKPIVFNEIDLSDYSVYDISGENPNAI